MTSFLKFVCYGFFEKRGKFRCLFRPLPGWKERSEVEEDSDSSSSRKFSKVRILSSGEERRGVLSSEKSISATGRMGIIRLTLSRNERRGIRKKDSSV